MLKENLRLIFKNKLTWIVFGVLLALTLVYTFYEIFIVYKQYGFGIVNYEYLCDKPYAATSWSDFYERISIILLLVTPISLCFVFQKKLSFISICDFRTKKIKQIIYQSISVALVTTLIFFSLYLISFTSFYLTMGFEMEPWKIDYHKGLIEEITPFLSSFDSPAYFGYDLFWINNGGSTYLFFLLFGLLVSFLYMLYITMASVVTSLFSNKFRPLVFIVFLYAFFFLTTFINDYGHYRLNLVNLLGVFNIDKSEYLKSIFAYIILCSSIIILAVCSLFVIEKIKRRDMGMGTLI